MSKLVLLFLFSITLSDQPSNSRLIYIDIQRTFAIQFVFWKLIMDKKVFLFVTVSKKTTVWISQMKLPSSVVENYEGTAKKIITVFSELLDTPDY